MPFECEETGSGADGGVSVVAEASFDPVDVSASNGRKEPAPPFWGRRASVEVLPPANKTRIFSPGSFLGSAIIRFSYREKKFNQ
jgi:hypothetical protein